MFAAHASGEPGKGSEGGVSGKSRAAREKWGGSGAGSGSGGGGAASSKGVVEGTFSTVDGVCGPSQNYAGYTPVNQDDPHYSSSGSGQGGSAQDISGTRGRVVLIVGGEPTFFDSPAFKLFQNVETSIERAL